MRGTIHVGQETGLIFTACAVKTYISCQDGKTCKTPPEKLTHTYSQQKSLGFFMLFSPQNLSYFEPISPLGANIISLSLECRVKAHPLSDMLLAALPG